MPRTKRVGFTIGSAVIAGKGKEAKAKTAPSSQYRLVSRRVYPKIVQQGDLHCTKSAPYGHP
jgi:hypothetical protein